MRLGLDADGVLTTTRSVRKRLDLEKRVEREVIEECLDIALQAPTGSNTQGWQWVFVTDPEKKRAIAGTMDEVDRLSREGVGQIFVLLNRLATAQDGIVCIIIWLVVTHVIGIDELFVFAKPAATVITR